MGAPKKAPGPAADRTFATGTRLAAVGALAGLGLLYWLGFLTPASAGIALAVFFPVYMIVVASVLSVWLGYDRRAADLRRVRRNEAEHSLVERDTP